LAVIPILPGAICSILLSDVLLYMLHSKLRGASYLCDISIQDYCLVLAVTLLVKTVQSVNEHQELDKEIVKCVAITLFIEIG